MNESILVTELATDGNFFLEGYLMANHDVAESVKGGNNGALHFENYGRREGRRQISRQFFDLRAGDLSQQKYDKFKRVLDTRGFKPQYLGTPGRFPMVLADRHYSHADYAAESANNSFPPFVEEMAAHPDRLYLDIGCGLRDRVYPNCLYVEVYPSLTADLIVGTDCTYPIKSESMDGVGCFAVLEHTRKPWIVAQEIRRILKPGGLCFIDYPFLQAVHGYPSHYFNATREGLKSLFSDGFEIHSCDTLSFQGPDYMFYWIMFGMLHSMPEAMKSRVSAMTIGEIMSHPPQDDFWKELISTLPPAAIETNASGNTLIARKIA